MAHLKQSPLSFIPLSPSNLRPFGAPPSIGRRAYPREPLPLEGAAERSEAGLASFFAAKPPPLCLHHRGRGTAPAVNRVLSYIVDLRRSPSLSFIPLEPYPVRFARPLPHWGRGTALAVDRVLSYIAYLRRSPSLSFIPLEPYPARFARHLPHAGKAMCRGYPLLKRRRSRHLNPEP